MPDEAPTKRILGYQFGGLAVALGTGPILGLHAAQRYADGLIPELTIFVIGAMVGVAFIQKGKNLEWRSRHGN